MNPVAARTFFEAVGIDTHPNRRRTAWGQTNWESAFAETGVANTRGLIGSGRGGHAALSHLQGLFGNGVKLCATVAPKGADFDLGAINANIDFLANTVGAENLCGIESANEYNKPSSRPADWVVRLRHFQAWLYETVKAHPALRAVPVVGPSLWGRLTSDIAALGSLEPYVDKACLHYYTGGRRPTRAGKPSSASEGGGTAEYALTDAIREARTQAPTKPLYITEYGYPIAGPGLPLSSGFITETAAAKYLIRGLLDMFGDGVEKIFVYSLLDDEERNPPRYHGLMSTSLSRRKTFYAIKNLIALMYDPRRALPLRPLDLALDNNGRVKSMLFQKSDGAYLLTLYQDVDSYDRTTRQDIAVAPVPVSLTLARPAAKIETFIPNDDVAAKQSVSGSRRLTIPIRDEVTVVKITP